ncbi:MAG TPA: hypothetical protein VGR18_01245 [Rubrobacter sp.]|nr:hypothetical protein [Rubrobacter sp.]
MTSDKKAEANRRNALKSTGPRTPEGKNRVRLNALRHGLRAEEILLAGEDKEALRELDEHLRAELAPYGELERLLVDQIVAAYWRLRRVGRVESGIFAWERSEEMAERAEREAREYESDDDKFYDLLFGPEITDEKRHGEALARARRMRSEQEAETATLGRTFARDADKSNAFSKLSRYESSIERQIYRALHELERRQAARSGTALTPPQILDVDVSGMPGEAR